MRKNDGLAFKLDGEDFVLRFDYNALCDLEDASGVDIDEFDEKMSLRFVRTTYQIGLRGKHPDLSLARAGEIVGELGVAKAGEMMKDAMKAAFPEDQKGKKKPEKNA